MISMLKTRSRMLLVVTTAMIALCGAQHALAQHGAIMVINNDDDGNGPMISHFSMPDLTELRAPDFTKRDLPTFQEKLVLSEAQLTAFERQIEAYLETFEKLKKDLLSVPGAEPMVLGKLAGLDLKSADGVAGESGPTQPLDDGADEPFWAMDGIDPQDMPEGLSLSVGVSVGGDDEESAVAAGQPSVAINFATRDGEEIPEEVRKKLEKAAAEMAEQIKQQIEQQIAEGKVPGKPEGGPGVLGPARAEDLKKRQEELEAAAKAFRKAKADLRQTFVLDAQTKLTTDQVERWPALERALLRSKSLPKGRLNGERTDLFKVLKSVAAIEEFAQRSAERRAHRSVQGAQEREC